MTQEPTSRIRDMILRGAFASGEHLKSGTAIRPCSSTPST